MTGLSANFIYLKSPKEVSRRVSAAEEPGVGIPRLCWESGFHSWERPTNLTNIYPSSDLM